MPSPTAKSIMAATAPAMVGTDPMMNQEAVAIAKPSTIAESGSRRFASAVAGMVTTMIVIASTVSITSKRENCKKSFT